jgi:myo-inositol 2-dehydrogenase/D-chiro-inositol 1-dehydrogenase
MEIQLMEQELRVGLIGIGAIGRTHVKRINTKLQGARVTGAADVNVEFGRKAAQELGLAHFNKPEDLIDSADIDAVVVASSDEYHETFTIASIEAGKFVFCEKPLAPTVDGARRVVEAEIAGGKNLVQVGFMRRYDPGYGQLKKIIDSGEIGEALMLHCAHRNPQVFGSTAWDNSMSVENSMIHEIDVLRWLLGEEYATAEVVFPKKSKNAGDYQDPQIMILTTKSGVRIDVESYVNCRYGYDIQCEVVCESGVIRLPEPNNATVRTNASIVHPICDDWSQRFPEAYDLEFQAWITASKEGRVDGPTAWDGYVAAVTAAAASKSRETQLKVELSVDDTPSFYA